jgi:hypothetical protein
MGGKVFANTSIKLDHTGYYRFCGDVDELKKKVTGLTSTVNPEVKL